MTKNPLYFRGIGSYDPETGTAVYNVIVPKIEGLTFHFHTDDVRKIDWEGEESLMIFTDNGRDDDNYGTTPEVVQIRFTVPDVHAFGGRDITVIINHDADKQGYSGRTLKPGVGKPKTIGLGTIRK
ncbi:MAG: hypothetical protein WCY89_04525 [Flavobacteriaceae bacterium]